ncbi:Serine/threonine-protein kinase Kist, partial [Armadillidium vulgare]
LAPTPPGCEDSSCAAARGECAGDDTGLSRHIICGLADLDELVVEFGTPLLENVTPKGYFEYEGRDVLVHELLSCTVKDIQLLHQNRPTSVWLITTFAKHLMRGLAHMHKNGVVHGDVKPHNIMWSGLEETFKLIDFGVSFSLNENMEHAIQSRDKHFCLIKLYRFLLPSLDIAAYQAPETIRWNQFVQPPSTYYGTQLPCIGNAYPTKPGAEADVWSAGCIIAELMTGSKVFTFGWSGENVEQVLKERLQIIDEDFPMEFMSLWFPWFRKCLEEDRANRWSAEEALKDSLLSEPQKGSEKPTMFDLLTLPTTVLRIVSLVRAEMDQEFADEIVETVVEMANSCCEGTISPKEYTFYNPNGSLYLVYEDAQDARSAYEILRRSVVKDFTLAVTFFPKEFYENSNFF